MCINGCKVIIRVVYLFLIDVLHPLQFAKLINDAESHDVKTERLNLSLEYLAAYLDDILVLEQKWSKMKRLPGMDAKRITDPEPNELPLLLNHPPGMALTEVGTNYARS
ncbi:unnamed protein product [Hydatigera taeniaeformis]|uniref:Uncharacterized protein n=1 Tax=Hydatigena taeniaeformis TaxID=6205 RepID=A0A3P7EIZ2_HYDTA|nr:unnamed protein product [Hydatigera taeniaeformis]